MKEQEQTVLYYVTVNGNRYRFHFSADTKIKTKRGTLNASELESGEDGEMWGTLGGESKSRWIPVQRGNKAN